MADHIDNHSNAGSTPDLLDASHRFQSALIDWLESVAMYNYGLQRSFQSFMDPYFIAAQYFLAKENEKLFSPDPEDDPGDFISLLRFNLQLAAKALESASDQVVEYHAGEMKRFGEALIKEANGGAGKEGVDDYMAHKAKALTMLALDYPKAIRDIRSEFGFHFNEEGYVKIDETERMELYQVMPNQPGVQVREGMKPILIGHPYVLGPDILAFLPNENKSYVHAFANQGIPTYVRIVKSIDDNPAVQIMSGEDDALDTARFCRVLKDRHRKPVTINGFCQGGFNMLVSLLTGKLEGLVDALITCAAPMEGTRSRGLRDYLEHLSPRFRNLGYAIKTLPNGNQVVDGKVLSWVYKLKSIDRESPVFTFYRDLKLFKKMASSAKPQINKTAAAINHWLIYCRTDLPVKITDMSFKSYTIPITEEGILPFRLFGEELRLDYINEKGIKFLICYAAEDDLVDPPSAIAPADFVDVELTEFPKGHASIATSWSHPDSQYAVNKVFPNGARGPVRFQLDLDEEISD